MSSVQDGELLAKSEVFQSEVRTQSETVGIKDNSRNSVEIMTAECRRRIV